MKKIITIINIVSAAPIIVYPLMLINTSMAFDSEPKGFKFIVTLIAVLVSFLYPVYIITLIVKSRKKNSLQLALLALIPLLLFLCIFLVPTPKSDFEILRRDFICDSNSFISIRESDRVDLLEKKESSTSDTPIANINNNSISLIPRLKNSQETKDLLSNCKNKDGKSLLDIYNLNEI